MAQPSAFTLTTQAVARVAALLWLGCGALVAFAIPLLPLAPGANRGAIVAVGVLALVVGAIVWFLPWERWGPSSTLTIVPVAFAAVSLYDMAAKDPWSHAIFFIVAYGWIGLAHKPGTALRTLPLFVVAYLLPLLLRDGTPGVASLVCALPTALLLGESVSWVGALLRDAELARARSHERFEALVRFANEYVVVIDVDGTIAFASAAVDRVLGFDPAALVGTSITELVHPDDLSIGLRWFEALDRGGAASQQVRYRVQHVHGGWRWIEGTISDLRDQPGIGGIVVNGQDIGDRVMAEQRLEHLARHDPLTHLPNRAALLEHLASGTEQAVLFIDLDGFKLINDSLGHSAGDEVLVAVAARVQHELRAGDLLARLGGDEFMVVVRDVDGAIPLAARVLDALRVPLDIAGRTHVVGASVGIAVGAGTTDGGELIRRADLAMYRAKELGRDRYVVFDQTLAGRVRRRVDIEAELRAALDDGELRLRYQPEVDMHAGRTVGMEAVVSWQHPTRGLLASADFIDIAEASDLIVGLGGWVLTEACATAARWVERFGDDAPRMSVDVSMRQLRDPAFPDDVRAALGRAQLAPSMLRLEVTEEMLADASAPVVLTRLRQLGISVAVDGFGSGSSSLSHLDSRPIEVLKIGRTFLGQVVGDDDRSPVVEAAIAVARTFGLRVVAEGVETPAHVATLLRLGCRYAQGSFFGQAVPAAAAERLLADAGPRLPLVRAD